MALYKLDEYYHDYSTNLSEGYDIKTFDVYR
ncbi:hypothetical protein Nos7524_4736 [Nostoc sp. PCC 7524]|nr:hypothetical protein Nos7524_4736 [Nostoc sp. PCC 7524]